MIGELVGSYRIVSTLGAGGMGVVYRAEHQVLGRPAAIKVLLPELSHHRDVVERFFNEARASALIRHPGIVDILDFGHHRDGSAYIVMEYLEGESLGACLRRAGRLGEATAVAIARQAAGALAAAHAQGIIHRDLKPDNLFLVRDPDIIGGIRVKILDFGIAKLGSGAAQTVVKTRTGAVMGSPLYMSPEQSRGARAVDERSDVYSLGCVFFEMLAGRPPFVADGAGEVIGMHIYEKPPRVRSIERSVPAALDALIAQTLAKDPERRPRGMNELVQAIDKATGGRHATQILPGEVFASSGGSAAPPVSTTLGSGIGEAAEIPARARRRWPLVLIAVTGVGALAAAFAAFTTSRSPPVAAVASPVEDHAADATTPAPTPAAPVTPAAQPARPARTVTVRLTSVPPGAAVTVNGARVATTPSALELPFSATTEARVRLSLDGYRDEELLILPDMDRAREVRLSPRRRDVVRRPAAPPPPRAKGDPVDPFAP